MGTTVHVLLIDDSDDDRVLIDRTLKQDDFDPVIKRVESREEMREALQGQDWDVILCDYYMPRFGAEEALDILTQVGKDIPFIIVSGVISEDAAVKLMKMGANDYVKKDRLSRLGPVIRREMKEAQQRSEKRIAQAKLYESERRYRMLVQSMMDTIFVVDLDGTVQEYHSTRHFCDTIPEVIEGETTISDLFKPDIAKRYKDAIKKTFEEQTNHEFEFVIEDHCPYYCHTSLSPHEDDEHVVIVLRDISQLKKTEQELRATYRIAMLYFDLMSHDIRNYLQAMKIGIELVMQENMSNRSQKLLNEVMHAIDECADLISAVSATKDILQTPMMNVPLLETLSECIRIIQNRHENVQIEMDSDVRSAVVQADKYLILLFMNLLENAVVHNNSNQPHIWIKVIQIDNGFEIRIADNGPGISDSMKKTLFDPNRRFGGVGVHQVIQLCEKYGGRIDVVDRDPNNSKSGVEFRVWLPAPQINDAI